MMPDELIPTSSFGDMEVYLVELRSIGGLSGSPVFVLKQFEIGRWRVFLLGLIHGHWEIDSKKINDDAMQDPKIMARLNAGIAMVAPAKKILETIEQQKLSEVRSTIERKRMERKPPPAS